MLSSRARAVAVAWRPRGTRKRLSSASGLLRRAAPRNDSIGCVRTDISHLSRAAHGPLQGLIQINPANGSTRRLGRHGPPLSGEGLMKRLLLALALPAVLLACERQAGAPGEHKVVLG